jgi:hypothetical protein
MKMSKRKPQESYTAEEVQEILDELAEEISNGWMTYDANAPITSHAKIGNVVKGALGGD